MITVAHEPSITGLKVAREIFDGLHKGDIRNILKRLDQSNNKWDKAMVDNLLSMVGRIGDWRQMKKSACPIIDYNENGFEYYHRFPGERKWTDIYLILTFFRKGLGPYHVQMTAQQVDSAETGTSAICLRRARPAASAAARANSR